MFECKSCGHNTPVDNTKDKDASVSCEPCGSPLPSARADDHHDKGHSE